MSWAHFRELLPIDRPLQREFPLGIILCAGKNTEEIELLELGTAGIHVAEYMTVLPAKEVLEQKLHLAIAAARLRFESKGTEDGA